MEEEVVFFNSVGGLELGACVGFRYGIGVGAAQGSIEES